MAKLPSPSVVNLTDELAANLFEEVLTLNNNLASAAPAHLCAVRGKEDEFKREQALACMGAVLDFLRNVGVAAESREPLFELYSALSDAKNGIRSRMFISAKFEKREKIGLPVKPVLTRADDGMVVAAVDILQLEEVPISAALRGVARAFGYDVKKLESLRKNLRAPAVTDKTKSPKASAAAVEAYDYWLRKYRGMKLPAIDFVNKMVATRGFKGNGKPLDLR